MPPEQQKPEPSGIERNPLGDPRAFRGYSTNLRKLADPEKKSDFLPSFSKSVGGFIWEVAKIIVIALVIIKPIHYFLLQPFYVKGASMEPNFSNNEYLIVDQLSYRLHQPQRGDVIVLRNPVNPDEFFIKRLIGLPHERITINNNVITVYNRQHPDGLDLDEREYLQSSVMTQGNIDITLGTEEFYVLGDNRMASLDSRSFGPIHRSDIVGRTAMRAWPIHRARTFQTPDFQTNNSRNINA